MPATLCFVTGQSACGGEQSIRNPYLSVRAVFKAAPATWPVYSPKGLEPCLRRTKPFRVLRVRYLDLRRAEYSKPKPCGSIRFRNGSWSFQVYSPERKAEKLNPIPSEGTQRFPGVPRHRSGLPSLKFTVELPIKVQKPGNLSVPGCVSGGRG